MENLNNLGKVLNTYLDLIFKIGLGLVLLSTFFLSANITTEFYDTPKFLVLLIFVGIILILLMLRFTIFSKVVLVRTPLDIPLLLILAAGIASTILSPSPYISLLGNQLRIHGSLISIIAYVLFYFVLVNNLKGAKEVKWYIMGAVILAQVLALVTMLSFLGIKILPFPWTNALNFTPTGSSFSTTAILALLTPFMVIQILRPSGKPLFLILNSLFLLLSGLTIALTGTWATWTAAIFGLIVTLMISSFNPFKDLKHVKPLNLIALAIPVVIVALAAILSFIPPVGGAKNPLYTKAQNFPREIQLPLTTSWKISISAFRDSPFWGTGASTYLFDFTNYKPIEFNNSKLWNIRLDSSFNEYLQILATLVVIGLLGLVSLTALFVASALKRLTAHTDEEDGLKTAMAISGLAFFVILALHTSSLVLWIVGILILASFMAMHLSEGLQKSWSKNKDLKSMFFQIATNVTSHEPSKETIKIDALPGVLLVIALALVLFTGFFGGKFLLADYHHRLALNAVAQNQGIVAYNELVKAEKLNPYSDLYRTDLAQTNFALANAIAAAKAPTEASPAGSLTDQDKQNIQVLIQQSINEGRTAVALSPKSAINWEILATLYRQISGVAQNALIFSLDSYGRAIFQDPLNPNLRINVGGVYYAVKNYDMAIRFFTDAINLKPDFANGYYNLSVALRDKGDLSSAKTAAEKVLTLIQPSSPDYKIASEYLNELNNKINSGSTQAETPAQPPAAETNGSLQNNELPKVINLPKPEKIATPSAIKKPNTTPEPIPTQTPVSSSTP